MSGKKDDKVWLCDGCSHGFMMTYKALITSGYFVYSTDGVGSTDGGDAKETAFTYCLCSREEVIHAMPSEDRAAGERVKISHRITACDGFVMKEETP